MKKNMVCSIALLFCVELCAQEIVGALAQDIFELLPQNIYQLIPVFKPANADTVRSIEIPFRFAGNDILCQRSVENIYSCTLPDANIDNIITFSRQGSEILYNYISKNGYLNKNVGENSEIKCSIIESIKQCELHM